MYFVLRIVFFWQGWTQIFRSWDQIFGSCDQILAVKGNWLANFDSKYKRMGQLVVGKVYIFHSFGQTSPLTSYIVKILGSELDFWFPWKSVFLKHHIMVHNLQPPLFCKTQCDKWGLPDCDNTPQAVGPGHNQHGYLESGSSLRKSTSSDEK